MQGPHNNHRWKLRSFRMAEPTPADVPYNMQTRMYRAVGLHNPNENPSEANATDMMQMPLADSTFAGMMSARDKSRLDELYDYYLKTK